MNASIKILTSPYDFTTTLNKLKTHIDQAGLTLFACIDHSGVAQAQGLSMPPTQVLIFGNPHIGTALMNTHPSVALDLPFRVLVSEAEHQVSLRFHSPDALTIHGLNHEEIAPLKKLEVLVENSLST